MVFDGTALLLESLAGSTDVITACLPGGSPVLYYAATVPAGHAITVTVNPRSSPGVDLVLRLLPSCAATTCLAFSNDLGAGFPESLTWRNTTGAAVAVFLAVGTGAPGAAMFRLDVSIRSATYTESMIPAACDNLTAAPVLAGVNGDDTTSALVALPFGTRFFGEDITNYSVSSNGQMMLFTPALGFTTTSRLNLDIPNPALPNRFLAPFWDDLTIVSGGTSDARTLTTGATPSRRLTVQWTNWAIVADITARLTFQVKLFETTNVIEFHYCVMTPGGSATLATGASATVGMEDGTGFIAQRHSFNMAGAVMTGSALRFTPAP